MEIVYLLIPVSLVLVAAIVWGFIWAMRHGQFDDLERHGRDILMDDDRPETPSAETEGEPGTDSK